MKRISVAFGKYYSVLGKEIAHLKHDKWLVNCRELSAQVLHALDHDGEQAVEAYDMQPAGYPKGSYE
jgi:hypothetical protein